MFKQLRIKIGIWIMFVGLMLASCSMPRLPDPTVEYPTPPAALMQPSQNMQTIGEPIDNSSQHTR